VTSWKRMEIIGDNSLADSAISFVLGGGITLNGFYDFVRFWDAFVIYDNYNVEKLPVKDVHASKADFLDSHAEVKGFLKDLTYSEQEEEERWKFAEEVLTSPGYAAYLAAEGIPNSLRAIGEEQYVSARYDYSRTEVRPDVLKRVEDGLLKQNPDPRFRYLVPHLIRSHMNVYSQAKRAVDARYITLRETLIDEVRQYAEKMNYIPRPRREYQGLTYPESRKASEKMTEELESSLKAIVALNHPAYLALERVSRRRGNGEDLVIELEDMRDYLSDFRRAVDLSSQDLAKLAEINEMLRNFELDFDKGQTKFKKVEGWLSTWPIFSLTIGAIGIALRMSPIDAVASGGASDLAYHLFVELEKRIRENSYGLSAFKEIFGSSGRARSSELDEATRAFELAKSLLQQRKG